MNPTINFIYFLYNHNGMENALVSCFGEGLGKHFNSKLDSVDPKGIINLIIQMSDDNKELFLKWVDENYNYKS